MAISFDQAIDTVLDQRRQRQDLVIPLKAFSLGLDATGEKITGTIDGVDYVPTMHCLKQMATWMGVSHAVLNQYLRPVVDVRFKKGVASDVVRFERDQTDRELLVALFKNDIRDGRVDPEKQFKFRTYNDGTLRAMLSDRYAIIDNVWYLEYLKGTFEKLGGDSPEFVHWRGDADTIYANLRLPSTTQVGNDGEYGGMFNIGNCEIGKHRISITPSVWRQICTNGMMGWSRGQTWSKVHRGDIDLHGLALDISAKITDTVPMLAQGIAALLATEAMELTARPSEMIAQIADDHKLSTGPKGQAVAVLEEYANHESSFRNLFGVINAITRAAQKVSPVEQMRLEAIGGELSQLNGDGWKRINSIAANMKEEKRNKIFGRVAA